MSKKSSKNSSKKFIINFIKNFFKKLVKKPSKNPSKIPQKIDQIICQKFVKKIIKIKCLQMLSNYVSVKQCQIWCHLQSINVKHYQSQILSNILSYVVKWWHFMAFCGISWNFVAFHGILWHLWYFEGFCGISWHFVAFLPISLLYTGLHDKLIFTGSLKPCIMYLTQKQNKNAR